MRIFLSYSRTDLKQAEQIATNLRQANHKVFFDRHNIKVAEDFNRVIWGEIQKVDLFIFLISPNSVRAGSFALTELALAEKKWPNPEGKVFPVIIEVTDLTDIPIYASICHMHQPEGNVAAEVRAEVKELHKRHHRKKLGKVAAIIVGLVVIGLLGVLGYREYLDQGPIMARTKLAAMNLPFDQVSFVDRVSRGDLDAVNLFLAAGMDPNAVDKMGDTALLKAIVGDHVDVVRALIEANVDVNAVSDAANWRALGKAANSGQEIFVRTLLDAGVDNDSVNGAFVAAADNGHLSILNILLSRKVGQSAIDDSFVLAARRGDFEILRFLLEKVSDRFIVTSKALLETTEEFGRGLNLHRPPIAEQIETIKFLLDLGANVNAKVEDSSSSPSWDGMTPLLWVSGSNYMPKLAKLLLVKGADPNVRCECRGMMDGGWTPLTLIIHHHQYNIGKDQIDLLLANGANINLVKKDGTTPLMLAAAKSDNLQLVQTLLKMGANVNDQSETGLTALSYAVNQGNEDVVDALLSEGADIHTGRNPLLIAVRSNEFRMVEIFLAKGVDINTSDNEGETALMWAAKKGKTDIVRTLLAAGARIADKDKLGRTAEIFAQRGQHGEIIKLLQEVVK